MSNGFVRHKVVQHVFRNVTELFAFTPRTEGIYALDNYNGDIYIWNGLKWVLYAEDAIKVNENRRPNVAGYKRLFTGINFNADDYISSSVSSSGAAPVFQYTASMGSFYVDVNVGLSNFQEVVNAYDDRSYISQGKNMMKTVAYIYNEGIYAEVSSSAWSGSFYTEPSLSLA